MKIVLHSSGTTRKSKSISGVKRTHRGKGSHHRTGTKGFIAVDGEGITLENGEHRYALIAIGDNQIEDENGLEWATILDFLYKYYSPGYAFCWVLSRI